ncbi:MFS transporter [Pararobbsia alpina]|uniref:L-lactate transporter n=1 Tax=Pararobbsia alpina TaxID=621374 RepID=A0A6S7BKQ7_9BURK|nr:MFS transporter [Pararobbsia alpina]CAB3791802.1 L-lactate transporter [Pararobbsia alpina]
MFSIQVSTWLDRRKIHFGWVVVSVVFLTMLVSSAALGMPGALLQPLSREFHWSTEQISSALAVRFVLYGLMGPFSAMLLDWLGVKKIVCSALVLIGLGMALATGITALWQLVVLWGIMLGVGSGMTALVLATVISNRWFDKRRGLVVGMLTASSATGQLMFLPLEAWLIELYGWRSAVFPIFVACLLVAGLAFAFLRDRPEDLGMSAYGAPRPSGNTVPVASRPRSLLEPFRVLAQAGRNVNFWLLFGTFFVCGLSTNGLIQTHFISLCGDFGLAPVPAASVLAMMGAFDFFGTITSGYLSDRFDNRKLLFWYYGLRGLSLFWLPHSNFTLYGLSIFALFYGLDWVATVPPTVKLTTTTFGKEHGGMVFGWVFAGHQLGAAAAAYGAGMSRTFLLTYSPAVYAAGAACLIAAAVTFAIRRPARAPVAAIS